MLSKTAMALLPAASLVGAAALAPTTSLAQSGENHGFIAVNYPYCQENTRTANIRGDPPPTRAPRSVAKVGAWFARTASNSLQKKLNRAG